MEILYPKDPDMFNERDFPYNPFLAINPTVGRGLDS